MSTTEDEDRHQLSARTTPTWEMELLVSGATIFGLLQLPDVLDRAYYRMINISPGDYAGLLSPLWLYSKFAVITLMLTFIAHLCLRGYWVALVGMNSVYRGGIRWERLERGALARAAGERHHPSMNQLIERADNRATRVFGIGFGFAMVMWIPVMVVLLGLLVTLVVDLVAGTGKADEVFLGLLLFAALPWALARWLDKSWGDRLDPDRGLGRLAARLLAFYARLGMGRGSNPLVALFVSHEGRQRSGWIAMLLVVPVWAVLLVQMSLARGHLPLGQFIGLSAEDPSLAHVSATAFYRDAGPSRFPILPLPRIPSRIASGPYVELFVPFVPRLHAPAMEASCASELKVSSEPAATAARLQCLQRLSDIRLDGKPLALPLDASTDPDTGQPGFLAMIPVSDLAPGRHEISLNPPARPGRVKARYRVAFWK